jgi:hypothetical protein
MSFRTAPFPSITESEGYQAHIYGVEPLIPDAQMFKVPDYIGHGAGKPFHCHYLHNINPWVSSRHTNMHGRLSSLAYTIFSPA